MTNKTSEVEVTGIGRASQKKLCNEEWVELSNNGMFRSTAKDALLQWA